MKQIVRALGPPYIFAAILRRIWKLSTFRPGVSRLDRSTRPYSVESLRGQDHGLTCFESIVVKYADVYNKPNCSTQSISKFTYSILCYFSATSLYLIDPPIQNALLRHRRHRRCQHQQCSGRSCTSFFSSCGLICLRKTLLTLDSAPTASTASKPDRPVPSMSARYGSLVVSQTNANIGAA